jgi:hypothetical protein
MAFETEKRVGAVGQDSAVDGIVVGGGVCVRNRVLSFGSWKAWDNLLDGCCRKRLSGLVSLDAAFSRRGDPRRAFSI